MGVLEGTRDSAHQGLPRALKIERGVWTRESPHETTADFPNHSQGEQRSRERNIAGRDGMVLAGLQGSNLDVVINTIGEGGRNLLVIGGG